MTTIVDRTTKIEYDVYDYCGLSETYESLKDAREHFKELKEQYGKCSIVKRQIETTVITTEQVIQTGL